MSGKFLLENQSGSFQEPQEEAPRINYLSEEEGQETTHFQSVYLGKIYEKAIPLPDSFLPYI